MKRQLPILLFVVSFLFGINLCSSQTRFTNTKTKYAEREIDSLQNAITPFLRSQGKFQEVISLNKKLIERSKELKYSRGVVSGYIHIANVLFLVGKYDESLRFLQLADKENNRQDYYLSSWLAIEFGNNFDVLGFKERASKDFSKAIQYASKIDNDLNKKRMLSYAYNRKAVCKYIAEIPDSSLYYLKKSAIILPEEPSSTINVGDWYAIRNQADSAKHYFHKAEEIIKDRPDFIYQKGSLYWAYGTLYDADKQYSKAIDSYNKAQNIFQQLNQPNDLMILYKLMANTYDSMGMKKQSEVYFYKHTSLKDSLSNIKQPALDTSVIYFLEEQEKENLSSRYRLYYIIVGISIVSIIVALLGLTYYKKNKRKSILIDEKDEETESLKQKVNESFEEIIQLAKNNSPEFWGRFQEIYPEFRERILEINPNLKTSELILCAYIYLGFNTKDIAEYTFKAVQTIKNNKYNLRKRLSIPPQKDIVVWIRKQTES
ncbi:helix-turn-helix transcriptional regulator [Chryseobacterium oryctis]|uniref:Tetratricopeptide repeat-containing protein n=1 Tax=Chryseobacterium oryctis TaxID=2952618 RepID=A0ABT3HM17_9FLAO|nr:hypothetical protein [Chryseobacterium oryctis]MCW3160835.1 hypothetical protein [Chryseobacterium oryctis]